MPSIEQDILAWAATRPDWQRNFLKRIARGEVVDDAYIKATAKDIVTKKVTLEEPALCAEDLPSGTDADHPTRLISIGELENVNALLGDQTLTFGDTGVTVIYGDNGSGKSGYARLAKSVVGARIKTTILPNAFATTAGEPTAKITYEVGTSQQTAMWPTLDDAALARAHFYDEECGDDYLAHDTELAYRPSVLLLLDELITHVDAVRQALLDMINQNDAKALTLPQVPDGTKAARFIADLSGATPQADVHAFLTMPAGAETDHANLVNEVARLTTTDPAKEKTRLLAAASKVDALATHAERLAELLAPARGDELLKLRAKAKTLREAAGQASKTSFATEPLSGVGSETWRAMWEAAERFSVAEAYPDEDFPFVEDGSVCVLCQQPIQTDAQDRLRRFHRFVHNDVETQATAATVAYKSAVDELNKFTVSTADTEAAVTFLSSEDEELAAGLKKALESAAKAKARIGERLRSENEEPWVELGAIDVADLRKRVETLKAKAAEIDEAKFKQALADTKSRRDELEGQIALCRVKSDIETEIKRRKLSAALNSVRGKITTKAITDESSKLSRTYVTDAVKNHFIRESERLKLERVVLGDKGGGKGRLRHKPALEGATSNSPRDVLSEGEQTAAGLAGFFTEVEFDETKSSVILDDPMSSLDHERRDKAARRIVELARDRQVIVFTHDLMFLGEIVKVSDELNIPLTERAIERNGARQPGVVINGYPWKAKDAKSRIAALENDLARLKKDQPNLTLEEYERRTSDLAGKLSETWERIVRSEVVNKVVDRGTTEVRPKMFRLLASITDADDTDFQTGYGVASKWARRHDKSEEVNYTAPTPDEIQDEIARIKAWRDRVNKYA